MRPAVFDVDLTPPYRRAVVCELPVADPDNRNQPPAGPLSGLRVVELSSVLMGPFAAQQLGDLGADVVKVEEPGGDRNRRMGGGPHPEFSGIALNIHRNKRSVVLDLRSEAHKAAFRALLRSADAFVTNLRPGPLERLGLTYERLRDEVPRLVYCQAQGYRSSSDEGDRPAYDDIIQAETGMATLFRAVGGQTVFLPSLIADKIAGMTIVQGVLAALLHRERTGHGQRVEVPMFDAVLAFTLAEHLARAAVPDGPAGYSRILNPHRGPHRTKDGWLAVMPYSDQNWRALFREAGREERMDEPWIADYGSRLLNAERAYQELAEVIAERTTEDWLETCTRLGIAVGVVPTLSDVVADPELNRGMLTPAEHPVVGDYRQIAPPLVFSESPTSIRRHAPSIGEHTAEVLAELGYDEAQIAALIGD